MKEPTYSSHETNTTFPDIQKQIDAITDRSLTPENINTYADQALEDLISVISEAMSLYDHQPTIKRDSGIDHERVALSYYGLDPNYVEATLDHIADTAEDISRLKAVTEKLTHGGTSVITPPDDRDAEITTGDGSFEQKKTIPRLQTILLILEENFGIDIDPETSDPEQFLLIPGTITTDMMRRTPYNVLDIPALNRIVDVCDEEGNRTFVFDREQLLEMGITAQELKDMTKGNMKELLNAHFGIGCDLVYSHLFVEEITSLLGDIHSNKDQRISVDNESAKLLKINGVPEGYLSITALARKLRIDKSSVDKAIENLTEDMGSLEKYTFGSRHVIGLSEYQQKLIEEFLREEGALVDYAPDGYLSTKTLARKLGINRDTLAEVINSMELTQEFYRFGSVRTRGFSPEDQATIERYLVDNGLLFTIKPEGFLTAKEITRLLGVSQKTVGNALTRLSASIGHTEIYRRRNGQRETCYSPDQIGNIKNDIEQHGILAYPILPSDYMSIENMKDEFHIPRWSLQASVDELSNILGESRLYRLPKGTGPIKAYSPTQIEMIVFNARKKLK